MESEKKPVKGKWNAMSIVMILVGVLCIGVAVYGLTDIYLEYKKSDETYAEAEDEFVTVLVPETEIEEEPTEEEAVETEVVTEATELTEESEVSETEKPTEKKEPVRTGPWYEWIRVDLAGLQAKYPDVKGWLFFENESISYPIVQGETNDTYLRTTYKGKSATAGSIFMDCNNRSNFNDTHTLIYGHNMRNLSMFGKLKYYRTKKSYYKNHQYFQVFCGNEIRRYQIFAYQEVPVDSYVYTEAHSSAGSLANRLLETSLINPGIEVEDGDKIITLSTCTSDKQERFIVSAVWIDTYILE